MEEPVDNVFKTEETSYPEDGGNWLLRNVNNIYWINYTHTFTSLMTVFADSFRMDIYQWLVENIIIGLWEFIDSDEGLTPFLRKSLLREVSSIGNLDTRQWNCHRLHGTSTPVKVIVTQQTAPAPRDHDVESVNGGRSFTLLNHGKKWTWVVSIVLSSHLLYGKNLQW